MVAVPVISIVDGILKISVSTVEGECRNDFQFGGNNEEKATFPVLEGMPIYLYLLVHLESPECWVQNSLEEAPC